MKRQVMKKILTKELKQIIYTALLTAICTLVFTWPLTNYELNKSHTNWMKQNDINMKQSRLDYKIKLVNEALESGTNIYSYRDQLFWNRFFLTVNKVTIFDKNISGEAIKDFSENTYSTMERQNDLRASYTADVAKLKTVLHSTKFYFSPEVVELATAVDVELSKPFLDISEDELAELFNEKSRLLGNDDLALNEMITHYEEDWDLENQFFTVLTKMVNLMSEELSKDMNATQ